LFVMFCWMNGKGQDTTKSDWSFGISVAPNISGSIFIPDNVHDEFAIPFLKIPKIGYGFNLYAKYKVSDKVNFITGLSCDALTYEFNYWNTYFQKNYLTYYSIGVPLLFDFTSSINNKFTFHFQFGFLLGYIINKNDFNGNHNDPYYFMQDNFICKRGSVLIPFVTIGLGFQYKFSKKLSLFMEPQFFHALSPLDYEYYDSNSGTSDVSHYIQFYKLLSLDYKF